MNSSRKPAVPPADRRREPLMVREGGLPYVPSGERDPFEAWVELMEVVEGLCARWPARPVSPQMAPFRL